MSLSGEAFVAALEARGFDFAAGVPCSILEDVIAVLEGHPLLPYVSAVREDVAVGLATGAWFAGQRPAVLMQNSGLGTSMNALASLALMYGIPMLLVVTWRGFEGRDAPEHMLMGEITPRFLDLMGIPHRVLGASSLNDDLAWATAEMDGRMSPVAIVVPPGIIETGCVHAPDVTPAVSEADLVFGDVPTASIEPRPAAALSRFDALGAARARLRNEPVVHANGYICRESFSIGDRDRNFYMIGSMGMASAIGLGLALARPDEPSVVFDGDGNLLMSLGILAQVGALQPRRLVHCVFDNGAYGSTGNQSAISRAVDLAGLAEAAGYRTVVTAATAEEVEAATAAALQSPGPHFILARVTTAEVETARIPFTPAHLRDRFRASLASPWP